jgi:signal transduction histidine kinase
LDVAELVEMAVEPYRGAAHARGVDLHSKMPSRPVQITGDAQWLHRALSILVDNALRFSPADGQVDVAVIAGAQCVDIHVSDTGPGMEPAMQDYLFGAVRAEDLATRRYGGKGLSLLQARRIAELHGGTVHLGSSDLGAHIVLSLPTERRP